MDTEVIQPNKRNKISEICDNVTSSVYIINSRIKSLKSVVENIGTPKDNKILRDQIQAWQQEVNGLIKKSQDEINKLSGIARSASKEEKLQINKITSHFKDAVEGFCKIQEEVVQKLRSNLIYPTENQEDDANAFVTQEQIQVQRNLEFESQLLLERQKSVKQIESDILQLNSIMKELGALVHEQGTSVDTIENRIEAAYENVGRGNEELTAALQYQTKSRKRKSILVLILAAVLGILIGIIIWFARS